MGWNHKLPVAYEYFICHVLFTLAANSLCSDFVPEICLNRTGNVGIGSDKSVKCRVTTVIGALRSAMNHDGIYIGMTDDWLKYH